MAIYNDILKAKRKGKKLFAVLIDPDKFPIDNVENFIKKVDASITTHIFVGGSKVDDKTSEFLVKEIKKFTELPVVLFPGDVAQVTDFADAILFLSLVSGRNPDFLIEKHVEAVSRLRNSSLEVIPTGYILIEGGKVTAVEKVSLTKPMPNQDIVKIRDTAKACEYLGFKMIYLEAGSGAKYPVSEEIIREVKNDISIPLIVGGGIKTKLQMEKTYSAGADIVVIGTAFEKDENFFKELKK